MGKRRSRATGTPLSNALAPNDLWCADFKGEFKLGNGRYCYPLTVTDQASRFLLMCEGAHKLSARKSPLPPSSGSSPTVGSPKPFVPITASPSPVLDVLFNLSKLAVWWLRLGIAIERIKPGHPQQNGRHERMHLTLKKEKAWLPGMNSLQQQARFDDFVHEFNVERSHQAIAMKCPAEVYSQLRRPYQGLPDLQYPFHDRDVLVTACGRICIYRKKINVSTVLAGQRLAHQGGRRGNLARHLHRL